MTEKTPQTIYLKDYRPPAYRVEEIALEFDLGEDTTRVRSRMHLTAIESHAAKRPPLRLDGDELELVSIFMDGTPLEPGAYLVEPDGLTLKEPPADFVLEIETVVHPALNSRLEGLYISSGVFCTQCEAEGFRRITFFPDRPDVLSVFTTTIRASRARYPVLLSNGNLVEQRKLEDGRHMAVWHDPFPKPSYLFALVAGDLGVLEDSYRTGSGREVRLRIFTEHGNEPRCAFAMEALKRSMAWDEERFGLEYDLDLFNIVAVSDFNMGAMENKSLNVFNAKYVLADAETATDDDYLAIESIVAHEYFHNWTGNRVTCRDWFQLSLKEGLTVFRDQEFSADMRSRAVKRIQDVRALRARQFPEDSGPLAHPVRPDAYVEINNFYTATVYEKGAEVIGMMHTLLGPDGFRKGMDLYFERHDGGAVTCDDFVLAMEDANGADLEQFRLWYSQSGTPRIKVEEKYDEAAKVFALTLEQSTRPTPGQEAKASLHIPLHLGLLDEEGKPLPLKMEGNTNTETETECFLELKEERQTYRFWDIPVRPVVSLNRRFSAPVIVESTQEPGDQAHLMGHDPDAFNRWEAGQNYAQRLLLSMVEQVRGGEAPSADPAFVEAMGRALSDQSMDKAFLAQMLLLPSESYLGQQMETVDVDAIHQARQALRKAIALTLREPLHSVYSANQSNLPYSFDTESMGRRALRNMALSYLGELEDGTTRSLVRDHYRGADNMTDRMAALRVLTDLDGEDRTAAMADFYERFEDNAIVVDKWFSLQAVSSLPGTLPGVRRLLEHPAFSISNPNRVRALIGVFCSANPLRFHATDGGGYALLADQVRALDGINPQVAARLLAPMGHWRRFDEARQNLMKAELERILANPSLSKDAFEIASKSLA